MIFTDMKFTVVFGVVLVMHMLLVKGIQNQPTSSVENNRLNRGVQTFNQTAPIPTGLAENNPSIGITEAFAFLDKAKEKPVPPSYTVVGVKRFYPFAAKLNLTDGVTNGTVSLGGMQSSVKREWKYEKHPIYVKVPIMVPVNTRELSVHPQEKLKAFGPFAGKHTIPRSGRHSPLDKYQRRIRGLPIETLARRPRHGMKPLSVRRKFVSYYRRPEMRGSRSYLAPKYHKTGIHDLYKRNMYYKTRGKGYEVTEDPFQAQHYIGHLRNFAGIKPFDSRL